MKIAVASENDQVTQHFGHCSNYNLYIVEDSKIIEEHNVKNPGHEPGFLPRFLSDMQVNVMISGGMGQKAVDIFKEKDIEVVIGAKGNSKAAAQAYLDGKLKGSKEPCAEEDHENKCED